MNPASLRTFLNSSGTGAPARGPIRGPYVGTLAYDSLNPPAGWTRISYHIRRTARRAGNGSRQIAAFQPRTVPLTELHDLLHCFTGPLQSPRKLDVQ